MTTGMGLEAAERLLAQRLDAAGRRGAGAYYTSPDVAQYLAAATILPALLAEVRRRRPELLPARPSTRELLSANVDLRSYMAELISPASDERLAREARRAAARLRVIDPTCGTGEFLLAAADVLAEVVEACQGVEALPRAAAAIVANLHGLDLMPEAVAVCRARLAAWAVGRGAPRAAVGPHVRAGNALTAPLGPRYDVVLGNPPYLEARDVDYAATGFRTQRSGAVHAWCVERALGLLRPSGTIGMIVPLALVATQRMKVVQELIEAGRDTWYANFAWRPARLFADVNRALTVFLAAPADDPRTFATGYQRWTARSRPGLLHRMRFTEVPRRRDYHWVPKLSCELERGLLEKCLAIPTRLGDFQARSPHRVYYRTTGGLYWKVFTDFPPAFAVDGRRGRSSRQSCFALARPSHVPPAIAALSSSTFWWWYTISSNLRDLNPSDIAGFPLPAAVLEDRELARLGRRYLADLRRHSRPLVRVQPQTGRTQTQGFKVQKSKPILDAIDRALARHYGFTPAETEFLVHYDESFRLGAQERRAT